MSEMQWLALLVDEPSPIELQRLAQELLRDTSDSERGAIEQAHERAAAILERLEERKRRTDELTVLNDLARRLASLRDSAEVLGEVAVQARRLLGVSVAYIMLHSDDAEPRSDSEHPPVDGGRLRIEVADGSIGSALRGIELDVGSGLGGQVLRSGQPRWSREYLADQSIEHLNSVDAVAVSENLGGILGVPILVADETIGVLLAADRRPRDFEPREVELLAALAAHAGVAIRNAELFEQAVRAAEELAVSHRHLLEINESRQQLFELRERLSHDIIEGAGVQGVAESIAAALRLPVVLLDDEDRLRAATGQIGAPPQGIGRALFDAKGSGTHRVEPEPGIYAIAALISLPSGYAGCVVALDIVPPSDEAVRMLEIGANSAGLLLASERALAEAELRARGELIYGLLSETVDEAGVRRQASRAGVDLDSVRSVVCFRSDDSGAADTSRLAMRLSDSVHGWSMQYLGDVVVLSPAETGNVRTALASLTSEDYPGSIAIARSEGTEIGAIRDAYRAAHQTVSLLEALGRERSCVDEAEMGIYRAVFSETGRGEIEAFVIRTIGPLLDFDAAHDRGLVETLETYLEFSQHHARSCAALHIHTNTLYQRLGRISELLGERWRESPHTFEVQLALRMARLLRSL